MSLYDGAGPCMALNGAIRKVKADYALCCDMSPNCASFYADVPRETKYLIASRCDPATFDALADRDVRLWHVNDTPEIELALTPRIGAGPSVGLKSLVMAAMLGYNELDVYGLDACYIDGRHHAYPQDWAIDDTKEVEIEGRTFLTTVPHLRQLECFVDNARELRESGITIRVHGEGMIAWVDYLRGMGFGGQLTMQLHTEPPSIPCPT